jgi:hypothetical protein
MQVGEPSEKKNCPKFRRNEREGIICIQKYFFFIQKNSDEIRTCKNTSHTTDKLTNC